MAGFMAKKVNAAVLILYHISSRYKGIGHAELVEDAKQSAGEGSTIAIAYDFMEILVPWLGFRSIPAKEEEEVAKEVSTEEQKSTTQRTPAPQGVKDWVNSLF